MALVALVVFHSIQNNFVRLYSISCHVSKHLKNSSQLANFYVTLLILRKEEAIQHFHHIMLYNFKKDKNATEMQEKLCAVYGEGEGTSEDVKSGL